jgi:DNA end-binding protein Ku
VYLTGKNYYLVPDGPMGQKAYQVIYQGMIEADSYAIGQVVMHSKEQLVLLRPTHNLLMMSQLNFANQVASPATFEEEITKTPIESEELQLVKTLIKSRSKPKLDMSPYKDEYTAKLTKLIEAKVAGEELVAPASQEPIQVINLMDALRKSVAQVRKEAPAPAKTAASTKPKPPRKMAPSKGVQAEPARKRKSS